MFTCLSVLILLILATYTDLTTRKIPNVITYPFILLGVCLLPFRPFTEVALALLGVLLSYIFYRLGIWAGGDAKLFFAISLLLPHLFLGLPAYIWLIIVSVVVGGLFASLYVLVKVFRSEYRRKFTEHTLRACAQAFALAVFVRAWGVFGILALFLPLPLAFFSALALVLVFPDLGFIPMWLGMFAAYVVVYLLSLRSWAFSRVVSTKDLKEGDVPAEFVTPEGKRLPVTPLTVVNYFLGRVQSVVDPLKARGLTEEDIDALRKVGVENVRVRTTVPFVPFVLIAYVLLMTFAPFCT